MTRPNRFTAATRLLDAARAGDRRAAEELFPLVYDELRQLAGVRMDAESPGHTLDATALVHEAYLRLVGDQLFDGRGHFFAAAAEAMRRILSTTPATATGRSELEGGCGSNCSIGSAPSPKTPTSFCRWTNCSPASGPKTPTRRALAPVRRDLGRGGGGGAGAVAYRNWKYARAWLRDAVGK